MTEAQLKPPHPAYSTPSKNQELYSRITNTTSRKPILSHTVPQRSGYAWCVPAGHIFRLTTPEGPQVGDLNLWSLQNPRERFWAARTRQLQSSHVSVGDRLWSCLPYLRPMCTIVADSLSEYGVDKFGGRCHDLLGTRCDPYESERVDRGISDLVNKLLTGEDYDYHCHSNLTRAILPYGLTEFDVHDVLNVFQVTGLNKDGKYFMEASPAKPKDYVEFFAEIDLLCALSTCPGGDLSTWAWGESEGADMIDVCRPIHVDVWSIEDEEVLEGWESPKSPEYKGLHGMTIPLGERKSD